MTRAYKLLALAAQLMAATVAEAQNDTAWNRYPVFFNHPFRTAKPVSFAQANAGAWIDGNATDNRLLLRVYLKQDLDQQLIKENADRQGAKNVAGTDSRAELAYYSLDKGIFKKDSLHWFAAYGMRDFSGATYSSDLFRLIGLGNKATEGDTADGNNFRVIRQRYDYLKGGFIWYLPDQSNLSVSVGVARGMRLIDVNARELSLYTAPYGEYMRWNVDARARMNRDNNAGYGDVNGLGAFLGVEYNRLISGGAFSAGINNLGFIRWFKGRTFSKDTTFTYNGWYVPLFSDLGPGADESAADSIRRIFALKKEEGAFNRAMPADLHIQYTFKVGGKGAISLRADQTFFSPMQTLFSGSYYFFARRFMSVSTIQAGGFGSFNVNQEVAFNVGRGFVSVKVTGIEGIVAPAFNGGAGLGLLYAHTF